MLNLNIAKKFLLFAIELTLFSEIVFGNPFSWIDPKVDIFNQLLGPIPIGNQTRKIDVNEKEITHSEQLSISGWLELKSLLSVSSIYQIFQASHIPSINLKENGLIVDLKHPVCPHSIDFLIKHQILLSNESLTKNPNCFAEKIKNLKKIVDFEKNNKKVKLEVKLKPSNIEFQFSFPSKNNIDRNSFANETKTITFDNPGLSRWVFFALSLDYHKGVGNCVVYSHDSARDPIHHQFNISARNINFTGSLDLVLSNNSDSNLPLFANLFQLNFYFLYFENASILLILTYPSEEKYQNDFISDLIFYPKKNQTFASLGLEKWEFSLSDKIEQVENGISFLENSTIDVSVNSGKNEAMNAFFDSKLIYFKFLVYCENNSNLTLYEAVLKNSEDQTLLKKIEVKIQDFNQSNNTSFAIHVIFESGNYTKTLTLDDGFEYFKSNELFIGFINLPGNLSKIVIGSKHLEYVLSETILGRVDLRKMNATLGNQNYNQKDKKNDFQEYLSKMISWTGIEQKTPQNSLILQRFTIFPNALSLISLFQVNSPKSTCQTPLILMNEQNSCFSCKKAVLFRPDQICSEYCPLGTRSLAGICVSCKYNKCSEIEKDIYKVDYFGNGSFAVKINRFFPKLTPEKIVDVFTAELENKENSVSMIEPFIHLANDSFIVHFNFTKTMKNMKFNIKANTSGLDYIYDEKRNFVYDLNAIKDVGILINNLSEKNSKVIEILGGVFVGLYLIMILEGVVLFFLSFCNHMHSHALKHVFKTFILIQMLVSFILVNVPLPNNFLVFILSSYKYIFGISLGIFGRSSISFPEFVNLPKSFIFPLFVGNFEIILLIITGVLLIYGLILVLSFVSNFLCKCFKTTISKLKKVFEFNLILVCVFAFDYAGTIFAILNLKMDSSAMEKEGLRKQDIDDWRLSKFISISYLCLLGFITLCLICLFILFDGFVAKSHMKYDISIFFIGTKNNKWANVCDLILSIMRITLAFCLAFFANQSNLQTIFILSIQFLMLLLILIIRPYQKITDNVIEAMNGFLLCFLLSFFVFLRFDKTGFVQNQESFEVFGWVLIAIYMFVLITNFLYDFICLLLFFIDLRRSKSLLFNVQNTKSIRILNNQIILNDSKMNTETEIKDNCILKKSFESIKLKDVKKYSKHSDLEMETQSLAQSVYINNSAPMKNNQSTKNRQFANDNFGNNSFSSFEEDQHEFQITLGKKEL